MKKSLLTSLLFILLVNAVVVAATHQDSVQYKVELWANDHQTLLYVNSGDTVIIHKKDSLPEDGPRINRRDFQMNCERITWPEVDHKWVATPGIHVVRRYIRYYTSDGKEHGIMKVIKIIVDSTPTPNAFRHPSLLVTASELKRISHNIQIDGHPMKKAWPKYKSSVAGQLNWNFTVPDSIKKINILDKYTWVISGMAVVWAITGEQKYADKGIELLNELSYNVKYVTPGWDWLHFTHVCQGIFYGADILKYYKGKDGNGSGWSDADIDLFDNFLREKLSPLIFGWPGFANGVFHAQNQNLNIYKARLMTGIYLNDTATFNEAYWFLFERKRTFGNAASKVHGKDSINFFEQVIGSKLHPGELMELNRGSKDSLGVIHTDYGHAKMCAKSISIIAELLWHQRGYIGDRYNMYGMESHGSGKPAIAALMEYLSRSIYDKNGNPYSADLAGVKQSPDSIGVPLSKWPGFRWVAEDSSSLRRSLVVQLVNHYKYRTNNSYQLPETIIRYSEIEDSKEGPYRHDILLHAHLNDGWVSPDTAKGDVTAAINNTVPKKISAVSFAMKLNKSRVLKLNIYSDYKKGNIKLYNLRGVQLRDIALTPKVNSISLKDLSQGVYIVKLNIDGFIKNRKIILK